MSDADNPELHAWRIKMLESSLASIHEKLDRMNETISRNSCPQPGLCVQIQHNTDRLTKIMESHEVKLASIQTEIEVAKTSGKIIVGAATAIGTIAAGIVSLAMQFISWPKK